ncbi:protein of unknown function [Quadrisphaera granulorum]|uniref:Uncharacterized protein DUF4386 n=1 Tax=Quadrisphaera granulorum TaxID=317664 RepID=A0A316AEK2_9ACTN|nr:DUF4386 domain-containing protein [Quadrisphaera granulorum]PWJ55789.1 uncharacterized protein DUF4386 [Quadrisphaera granulorum]SZE95286.1 protein of unknown function [Quadrisphaera granulorum]
MPHHQLRARTAGALYLVTFASSIPALLLLGPVLAGGGAYVTGADADARVTAGAALDVVNALACIGTAVALYPLVSTWAPGRAVGFVASRVLEAAVVLTGVACVLGVLALRQQVAARGLDETAAQAAAAGLIAVRDATFLLGPGLIPALNAVLLGSALLAARALPRIIPAAGLVGAPLLLASATGTLFGVTGQTSSLAAVAVVPIFLWELSLGLWMLVRGLHLPTVDTIVDGAPRARGLRSGARATLPRGAARRRRARGPVRS